MYSKKEIVFILLSYRWNWSRRASEYLKKVSSSRYRKNDNNDLV